ncbi:MAG TPA: RNA polymerase sigma factor [Fimbriimonadaceae bacterium]|nr:RNA polymerase sigma factor [Fimbriimonadaceae bacterium]
MAIIERNIGEGEGCGLVRRMSQGDETALRHAYGLFADPVYRFVLRRVRGAVEDAEEIVNDVFVAAIRNGASFDGRCSDLTWLCRVALGKISDRLRADSRAKRIPRELTMRIDDDSKRALRQVHDPSLEADEIADRLDRVRLVQALLDSLTEEQREAVMLRYVEGFSIAEVAAVMKRSEKAIERLLERAKERPRKEMFRWFGDEAFPAMCFDMLVL